MESELLAGYFVLLFFVSFFHLFTRLVRSQFPEQGLNQGHSPESAQF